MKKIDFINSAYSKLRISGLTTQAVPEEVSLALEVLEEMMYEFEGNGLCIGYNFEQVPDVNTEAGIPSQHHQMVKSNLAVRLIPDFNKDAPPILLSQASQSYSKSLGTSLLSKAREVQYPRRQPRGSGSTLRFNRWQRYYRPQFLPPNDCDTNRMEKIEVNDFQEDFHAYLEGERIVTMTILVTSGIELVSSSHDDTVVSYRIRAIRASSDTVWQQATITIGTNTNRVEIRRVNFEVTDNNIQCSTDNTANIAIATCAVAG